MNTLRRILVVVDNMMEFHGAARLFQSLPGNFEVHFCRSTAEASAALDQAPVDMVFADLSAGAAASTQFLQAVWARYPNVIRFLMGARIDAEQMIACAMGGHQFLQKPLDVEAIQAVLQRAELMDRLLRDKNTQMMLSLIRSFPPRPKIYYEVMKEVRSPYGSVHAVSELVSKDLAISAKLLQLINSAAYSLSQQITSPQDAVLLLGMQTTASLVLGIESLSTGDRGKPIAFDLDGLWRHSQSVAYLARQIAELVSCDETVAQEAFTAGLLHDIGKLALALNLDAAYQRTLKLAADDRQPAWEVERRLLGASHAEAGAYLLGLWGMPVAVIEAVASHHHSAKDLGRHFGPKTAVHLANALELAKSSLRGDLMDSPLDLGYHPGNGLEPHYDTIRELVAGQPTEAFAA